MRVLLVEDNERSSKLARAVLEMAGMTVTVAATGAAALQAWADEVPDVVLLDIQLPDLDGVHVLAGLRAQPAAARVPVIALTAFAMAGDRDRFLAEGFDGYLTKPIDVRTFAASVTALAGVGA